MPHVCCISESDTLQDVCCGAAASTYPTEQAAEQDDPDGTEKEQLPSMPWRGAVTLQEAATATGPIDNDANDEDRSSSGSKETPTGRRQHRKLPIEESRVNDRHDCDGNGMDAVVVATECETDLVSVERSPSPDRTQQRKA